MLANYPTPSFQTRSSQKLEEGKSVQDFRNRQTISSQGDPADAVFYIRKGRVKMTVVSKRGKEAVIGMVEPGDFFGESNLVAGHPLRMTSATSIGRSTIFRFEKDSLVRLLHEDAEFADPSCHTRWLAPFEWKKTWWISFLIRRRSGSPAFYCSWPTSAKTANLSR